MVTTALPRAIALLRAPVLQQVAGLAAALAAVPGQAVAAVQRLPASAAAVVVQPIAAVQREREALAVDTQPARPVGHRSDRAVPVAARRLAHTAWSRSQMR